MGTLFLFCPLVLCKTQRIHFKNELHWYDFHYLEWLHSGLGDFMDNWETAGWGQIHVEKMSSSEFQSACDGAPARRCVPMTAFFSTWNVGLTFPESHAIWRNPNTSFVLWNMWSKVRVRKIAHKFEKYAFGRRKVVPQESWPGLEQVLCPPAGLLSAPLCKEDQDEHSQSPRHRLHEGGLRPWGPRVANGSLSQAQWSRTGTLGFLHMSTESPWAHVIDVNRSAELQRALWCLERHSTGLVWSLGRHIHGGTHTDKNPVEAQLEHKELLWAGSMRTSLTRYLFDAPVYHWSCSGQFQKERIIPIFEQTVQTIPSAAFTASHQMEHLSPRMLTALMLPSLGTHVVHFIICKMLPINSPDVIFLHLRTRCMLCWSHWEGHWGRARCVLSSKHS